MRSSTHIWQVATEALPDLSQPSMQQINDGTPLTFNVVNQYVARAAPRAYRDCPYQMRRDAE